MGSKYINEVLAKYNIGVSYFAKLIGIHPITVTKFLNNSCETRAEKVRMIEAGTKALVKYDQRAPRWDYNKNVVWQEWYRDEYYREVFEFESEFKKLFTEILEGDK